MDDLEGKLLWIIVRRGREIICNHLRWGQRLAFRSNGIHAGCAERGWWFPALTSQDGAPAPDSVFGIGDRMAHALHWLRGRVMAYIGLFSLGLFVGCVLVLGSSRMRTNFLTPGVTSLGAMLSAVLIVFLDQIGGVATDHKSVFMYPIGLFVAMPWCHLPSIVAWKNPFARFGFILATAILTLAALALAFSPQVRGIVQ